LLSMTKSQKITRVIPPLIGCAIIFAMMWNLGLKDLKASILNANPYLLVATFFIFAATVYVFRAIRWIILFNKAKPIDAFKVMLIGLAINQVTPIGVGDLARVYIAKKRLNIAVGEALAPTVVERILDITFLAIAAVLFLFLVTTGSRYVWQIIVPVVLLIIGYGLLFNRRFLDKLGRLLENLKQKRFFSLYLGRVSSSLSIDTFKNAMLEFRGRRTLLLSILLTILTWGIGSIGEYLLLLAFGVKVPVLDVLSIYCASWLIGTFSFLPGGLGAKEVSFALLLSTLGVPLTIGMWASLIDRLIVYILVGGGAFVSLLSFAKVGGEKNLEGLST
jgi:uncharacterized protein (TIRG00374 family)